MLLQYRNTAYLSTSPTSLDVCSTANPDVMAAGSRQYDARNTAAISAATATTTDTNEMVIVMIDAHVASRYLGCNKRGCVPCSGTKTKVRV
jgi:hypothetical protein